MNSDLYSLTMPQLGTDGGEFGTLPAEDFGVQNEDFSQNAGEEISCQLGQQYEDVFGFLDDSNIDLNMWDAAFNEKSGAVAAPTPNNVSDASLSDTSLVGNESSLELKDTLAELPTVDTDIIVKITSIEPPPYDQFGTDEATPKKRNGRKASITTRQCSDSPAYEYAVKTEPISPSTEDEDVKPTIGTKRARKNSVSRNSSSSGASTPREKKPKLYEIDDPTAKNARAAWLNRQKKKQAMENLTIENQNLKNGKDVCEEQLRQSQLHIEELTAQLEEKQRRTRAQTGLNKILHSAKDVLETIMVPLHKKYGPWKLEVAPWFSQVETALNQTGSIPASLGGNDITSNFITVHINPEARVAMVDYKPETPVLPCDMPQ